MHNALRLICAGIISFTGFAVYAQQPPTDVISREAMIESLLRGGTMNISDNIMQGITQQFMETPQTEVTIVTEVAGPLVVSEPVPEINVPVAEILGTRDRYPPRLKINFAELPLRSLAPVQRNGKEQITTSERVRLYAITTRIKDRLRQPQVELVIDDRTAIVTVTVATERQRSLVESMLRFEPGIDAVQNRIVVSP